MSKVAYAPTGVKSVTPTVADFLDIIDDERSALSSINLDSANNLKDSPKLRAQIFDTIVDYHFNNDPAFFHKALQELTMLHESLSKIIISANERLEKKESKPVILTPKKASEILDSQKVISNWKLQQKQVVDFLKANKETYYSIDELRTKFNLDVRVCRSMYSLSVRYDSQIQNEKRDNKYWYRFTESVKFDLAKTVADVVSYLKKHKTISIVELKEKFGNHSSLRPSLNRQDSIQKVNDNGTEYYQLVAK